MTGSPDDRSRRRLIRSERDRLRLAWRIARGLYSQIQVEAMAHVGEHHGVIIGTRIDPIPDGDGYGLRIRANNVGGAILVGFFLWGLG
jgi:hypothetical protein